MIILALGAQGSGKTHGAVAELSSLVAHRRRQGLDPLVLVHDLRCYYGSTARAPKGARSAGDGRGGKIAPHSAGSIVPRGCWFASPKEWRIAGRKRQTVAKARVVGFHSCPVEEVLAVGEACYRARVPAILFLDELDTAPKNLQQTGSAGYPVVHYGRRIPVDVVGTARRPQNLDLAWMSEASIVLLYHLSEPRAREVISRQGWPDGDRISDALPRLPARKRYRLVLADDVL